MGGSKSKESSTLEEPKTYLEKSLMGQFILSVLWSRHIDFDFDCIVVPVVNPLYEIKVMSHFLMSGVELNVVEDLLEKGAMYSRMEDNEIVCREYEVDKRKKKAITIMYVRYPRYVGKKEDVAALQVMVKAVLQKAREMDMFRLVMPAYQPASIMTYPKSILFTNIIETVVATFKDWKELYPDFKLKLTFLVTEHSALRLMCKYMISIFEHEDFDEEEGLSQASSIDYLEHELDKMNIQKLKRLGRFDEDSLMKPSLATDNNKGIELQPLGP